MVHRGTPPRGALRRRRLTDSSTVVVQTECLRPAAGRHWRLTIAEWADSNECSSTHQSACVNSFFWRQHGTHKLSHLGPARCAPTPAAAEPADDPFFPKLGIRSSRHWESGRDFGPSPSAAASLECAGGSRGRRGSHATGEGCPVAPNRDLQRWLPVPAP